MPLHLHSLCANITTAKGLIVTISIVKTGTISSKGSNSVIKIHMVLKHGSLLKADPDSVNHSN